MKRKTAMEISNEIGMEFGKDYVQVLEEKVKRYEKALNEIIVIGSTGSKYESMESQLAKEALE